MLKLQDMVVLMRKDEEDCCLPHRVHLDRRRQEEVPLQVVGEGIGKLDSDQLKPPLDCKLNVTLSFLVLLSPASKCVNLQLFDGLININAHLQFN